MLGELSAIAWEYVLYRRIADNTSLVMLALIVFTAVAIAAACAWGSKTSDGYIVGFVFSVIVFGVASIMLVMVADRAIKSWVAPHIIAHEEGMCGCVLEKQINLED